MQERVSTGVAGFNATGFLMDTDDIRAGLSDIIYISSRLLHHHVDIKHTVCRLSEGRDHRHTEGNARNKRSVHHVEMDVLRSGVGNSLYILSKF